MEPVLVGADPELFVKKNGRFISGHGMIEGTKANPFKVDKGAVQVDGMALEFNIDPAKSEEEFVSNLHTVIGELGKMIDGYQLVNQPTAHFSKRQFNLAPPEALELGCDPDYNGWTKKQNPRPNGDVDFRTGAGHVHIGWGDGLDPKGIAHFEDCCLIARELDFVLASQAPLWDRDFKRQEMYGAPGAFRPKSYGMEYRVLSNAWVGNEKLERFIYRNVQNCHSRLCSDETHLSDMFTNNDLQLLIEDSKGGKMNTYFASLLKEKGYEVWDEQ